MQKLYILNNGSSTNINQSYLTQIEIPSLLSAPDWLTNTWDDVEKLGVRSAQVGLPFPLRHVGTIYYSGVRL